jgi:release factor glutamine methyltransferase
MSDPVVEQLRAAGCVFAEDEAALLESEADGAALQRLVERRVSGEPLELVLGWAQFCGLRIAVAPRVFVPRRRTEFLAMTAISLQPSVLMDLCCGTAAVAAAVSAALPDCTVYAADIDPDAIACARRNVAASAVFAGDLYAALPERLRGQVDVLTANAPYVPSDELALMPREARLYEAPVALDGGPDGLDVHRRILADAADWLRPDGTLLIETSRRQLERDLELCAAHGWQGCAGYSSEHDATVLIARRG